MPLLPVWQFSGIDPETLRHAAWLSVWARWFVWLVTVAELVYRPESWFSHQSTYLLMYPPLALFNGFLRHRLIYRWPGTWHWLLSSIPVEKPMRSALLGG